MINKICSRSLALCTLASVFLCSAAAMAQRVAPAVRIVGPINQSQLVTLHGSTLPAANASNDRGPVSTSLPMADMVLVLSRSPEQQAAFDTFVASQYDSSSPNYHQWLTPDQVGERFGPAQADIATITDWLTGHGFTVTRSPRPHVHPLQRHRGAGPKAPSIPRSTTSRQRRAAHRQHERPADSRRPRAGGASASSRCTTSSRAPCTTWARSVQRDSKPANGCARPAPPRPRHARRSGRRQAPRLSRGASLRWSPQSRNSASAYGSYPYLVEDVGPWDFATIYNVAPLWNCRHRRHRPDHRHRRNQRHRYWRVQHGTSSAPTAATTSPPSALSSICPPTTPGTRPFRSPATASPCTVCTKHAFPPRPAASAILRRIRSTSSGSGAVAKNAQIVLVASYPASTTDDNLYDSESYIVDHLTAHIMNVSYGECELGLGTAGNVQYYNLWQTAAAEGIAVFVATGDSGSASCDQGGDASGVPAPAEYGLSVSGLASTPFNTAVGGTDFAWCPLTSNDGCASEASTYWNTTNSSTNESNAKGYVPEVPWNDTCTSPLALPYMKSSSSELAASTHLPRQQGTNSRSRTLKPAATALRLLRPAASTSWRRWPPVPR